MAYTNYSSHSTARAWKAVILVSIFTTTFVFMHDEARSREFSSVGRCVRTACAKIRANKRVYAISKDGGVTFGKKRESMRETKQRAKEVIKNNPDLKVIVRAWENGKRIDQVKFATLTKTPPEANTPGVQGVDRIVGWIESEVAQGRLTTRRYAGTCVCKTTTSGGHSDHADCAAVDIFASNEDMETIRNTLIREAAYFNTKYVILYKRIHFVGSSKYYSGSYHAHVHASVYGGIYNSACR